MPANLLPVLWKSSRTTFRTLSLAARQLFHETAGAMFVLFAAYGVYMAWREWKTHPAPWLITFALLYSLMMAAFAYVSFRRAGRVK